MPLVLLIGDGMKVGKKGLMGIVGKYPLIRPARDTAVSKLFAKGLAKRKIDWPARIEVSTLELVESYVASGFGIGLSVDIPGRERRRGVSLMELKGFPQLKIAALWRGRLSPLSERVLCGADQASGANVV